MKVCVISEASMFGGAEIHTLQLVRRIAHLGHAVDIIECGNPVMAELCRSATPLPPRVQFVSVPLSTDTDNLRDVRRWIRALRSTRAKHGILIKNWYGRGAPLFLLAFRLACSRVSFIEHLEALPAAKWTGGRYFGVIPRLGLWSYPDRIRRWLPGVLADDVIAVSEKVRDRLASDCGYPPDKISVVRNGVAWQEFNRDAVVGAGFRKALGIPAGACVVAILARLEHVKGIDVAIRAMAVLQQQPSTRPVHLLIAGTGSLESTLKEQTELLGLTTSVTFTGFLANPKPALWASDIILFASRLEGLPLGLLEGMAAGCLPVVTRVSGMPEVVTGHELGWVIEPDEPGALAAALREVSSLDNYALEVFRTRVVAHIKTHFDLERSHERLIRQLGL